MNYKISCKNVFSVLVLITILGVCTESSGFEILGTREALETQDMLNSGGSSKSATRKPANRRTYKAPATNAKADPDKLINDAYVKMAENINANQKPTKDQIASNETALRVPSASRARMDKTMQAKYYILKAWNEYFSDDLKNAQNAAMGAVKALSTAEDARATLTAITLLAGQQPVMKINKNPRPKTSKQNQFYNTYNSYNTSSAGTNLLDLDVDSVLTDLTDPRSPEKILPMELNCLNSTIFKYTPGSESLCVIFWKLSEKDLASLSPSEPNDPSAAGKKPAVSSSSKAYQNTQRQYHQGYEDEYAMQYGSNPYGNNGARKQNPTFLSNTNAFKQMFSRAFGTDDVKFLAVNTDTLATKQKVAETIMDSPWPWAHVMAHDPKSRDTQFKKIAITHEKPLMVITSKDGTIRYAGPAVGFLAPMMLSKLTGADDNMTAATESQSPNGQNGVANSIMSLFNKPKTTGGNTADNIKPANTKQVTHQPAKMEFVDEFAAGKLLENARLYMKLGRRAATPKKGIELCRELLKKYPNTKYSEEARVLLRGLSERNRKKYNVTDEELGL